MRYIDNGSFYSVTISARELQDFAQRWPCSGMRGATRGLWVQFDKRNSDLVDIKGERKSYDESAVLALTQDAQTFARPFLECTNCGGPLPTTHGTTSRNGRFKFCDTCAAIHTALQIGARMPVMLYDNGAGGATGWTSGVAPLGTIVHKQAPENTRHFGRGTAGPFLTLRGGMRGAVRYRVRMLDGSLWYGHGPTENGSYIRLRPMKGE